MTYKLHNQSAQPIELHLPERVLVLAAHGSAEIEEGAKNSAQLQVLLKTHQVSMSEAGAGEPAKPAEPAVAHRRRPAPTHQPTKRK